MLGSRTRYWRHCLTAFLLLLAAPVAWPGTATVLPRYDLRVDVRPEARSLSVEADVTLPPAAEPRQSLQFELLPSMGTPEVRLAAPAAAGPLTVRKVRDGTDELNARATWEITPETPFPADQPISLHITHRGGDQRALVHHVGPDIVIASGDDQPWYPQFWRGKAKVTGSLRLEMPAGFSAVATGKRLSERVAAGRRQIDFDMTWPTPFAFTAAPYTVKKAFQGKTPVTVYLLRDRDFAADLADLAGRSIAILEAEFGRFPFEDFALAEVPNDAGQQAVFTGASLDGFMLMRSDVLDSRRADPGFFGHEIGHQWWGVSVSRSGDKGMYMLDEGLAQYSGLKVVEALRGPDAAKAFRDREREKAIKLIGAGEDAPLAALPVGPTYYELADAKGSLVYEHLGRAIGAERLRRFFHEVTAAATYSSITWSDYAARLAQAAGRENRWLLDQWLDRKGLPVLDLKWTAGATEVTVEIGQSRPGLPRYRLALPVRLFYADGSAELKAVEVAAKARTTAVLSPGKAVSRVELDPQHTLPWASSQEFAAAVAIRNATRAWAYWDSGRNREAEEILKAALEVRTAPDATPAEFLERYNYGWLIEEVYNKLPEALDQYLRALQLPVRDDTKLVQLYVNIARVATAIGDKPRARWAAQAAIALAEARGDDAVTKRIRDRMRKYLD